MPQVFPSNSLLQKPPPPTRSPPQPPPLNSLLPWDTSCSNAPLASYLEYILILLTLPPVTSSKSLGLHQMTFRPLSSVKKKHPARLFPVKVEGTATENCWQTRKKRMQWYFRGFNRHDTDFYSLISFSAPPSAAQVKGTSHKNWVELLSRSKSAFSIREVLKTFSQLEQTSCAIGQGMNYVTLAAADRGHQSLKNVFY